MRRQISALLALIMVMSACGSDNNASEQKTDVVKTKIECVPGTITGSGSTFVKTIVDQWVKDYKAACPDAIVNYQGTGSGAGIQQFGAGTVDFGGTDVVMKPDEQAIAEANGGAVVHIPWTSGAIAVMFNLEGISELNLSPNALAGIYSGKITKWNDKLIASDNSGVELPNESIQVVHRSDGSGTTNVFTSYLSAAAPSIWKAGSGKDIAWPTGQGAKGSDGVTATVKQTQGSISYAELSYAEANSLGVVSIKNAAGKFVAPGAAGVIAALDEAKVPADLKLEATYTPKNPAAYPISTVSWIIVHQNPKDPAKAKLLKSFLGYVLTDGQANVEALYYAPLPGSLAKQAKDLADTIGVAQT